MSNPTTLEGNTMPKPFEPYFPGSNATVGSVMIDPFIRVEFTAREAAALGDLLAALKALIERYGPASGYTGEQRTELLRAEAAIKKAEATRA